MSISSKPKWHPTRWLVSRWRTVTIAGLLLLSAGHAFAQSSGVVRGLIVDERGLAIDGARVVMDNLGTDNARFEVETNPNGRFSLAGLSPGFYIITADKDELGGELFRVSVRDGRTVEVNFSLEPGRRIAPWLADTGREALAAAFSAGVEANRAGDFAAAVERFDEALDLNPSCLECQFNSGVAFGELQQFVDAEAAYRRVLEIDPDYAAAYYGLVTIYVRQNRPADAVEARRQANRIALERLAISRAESDLVINGGITFLNAGNLVDARRRFEEALNKNRSYAPAHYWLGVVLAEQGEPDLARAALQQYLGLESTGEFSADAKERLDALAR
jgi:Flp pilus assembly protein TadD